MIFTLFLLSFRDMVYVPPLYKQGRGSFSKNTVPAIIHESDTLNFADLILWGRGRNKEGLTNKIVSSHQILWKFFANIRTCMMECRIASFCLFPISDMCSTREVASTPLAVYSPYLINFLQILYSFKGNESHQKRCHVEARKSSNQY